MIWQNLMGGMGCTFNLFELCRERTHGQKYLVKTIIIYWCNNILNIANDIIVRKRIRENLNHKEICLSREFLLFINLIIVLDNILMCFLVPHPVDWPHVLVSLLPSSHPLS